MMSESFGVCIASYYVLVNAIPRVMATLQARGIYGIDINKRSAAEMDEFRRQRASGRVDERRFPPVPESLGLVVGGVYLLAVCFSLLVLRFHVADPDAPVFAEYNAALCSIGFMLMLGFVDDVLDVKWRYKIIMSFFGTIPLLAAYQGPTNVIVPLPLRDMFGLSVELGIFYHVYMLFVCVFCTNSINILAGINGVEVGQTLVIALAVVIHNLIELPGINGPAHLLSLILLIPFLGAAAALWKFNQYPARAFVGDSFTYFSGMVIAVAGVCGHFSKTMMLFFAPQFINFALSLPQLAGLVPCPRHRVPAFDDKTGKLVVSRVSSAPGATMNLTLLNLILRVMGPMSEPALTTMMLLFQVRTPRNVPCRTRIPFALWTTSFSRVRCRLRSPHPTSGSVLRRCLHHPVLRRIGRLRDRLVASISNVVAASRLRAVICVWVPGTLHWWTAEGTAGLATRGRGKD